VYADGLPDDARVNSDDAGPSMHCNGLDFVLFSCFLKEFFYVKIIR
jgi:hypothetical protein